MAFGPLCTAFHDADQPRADDAEIAWYVALLPQQAGLVLDAMCGLGRLLVPLSERGIAVHGVDASAAMLAACEARVTAAGLAPKLYRQDLRELNLPFRYGAAYLGAGSFQLIAEPADARRALERVRAHLVPPAVLLLDLDIPDEALHPPGAPLVEVRAVKLADGSRITLRSETRVDAFSRRLDRRLRFERRASRETLEREDEERASTWYDEAQIRELLDACGFVDLTIEPAARPDRSTPAFGVSARG